MADPTQIHQIVMNLCTNAAHAMREIGGVLDVQATNILVSEAMCALNPDFKRGTYVHLVVRDSGHGIDAAIIDIMLPRLDGLTLMEELRREKISLPVLILSAKRTVDDRVRGLQTGGDDYMTKPFSFAELLARVQALIRRSSGVSEPHQLKTGDLAMNLITRQVTRENEKIDLQPLEFSLLEYLMRNAGNVVTKTMIMEHVWDYNFDPHTNVVEVRICRLRDKIDKNFEKKLIQTVRGVGYVLKKDE
jgi:two-component system OmpR family response regulator